MNLFNPTYSTLLHYIEIRVSPKGRVTPVAHFEGFEHDKTFYDSAPITTEQLNEPGTLNFLSVELTDKGPLLRAIRPNSCNSYLNNSSNSYLSSNSYFEELPRRYAIYPKPIPHAPCSVPLVCPHCGTLLVTKSPRPSVPQSLICPEPAICPAQNQKKGAPLESYGYDQANILQKVHPHLRLSYPMFVVDPPRFIHACNIYGALAWHLPWRKGEIYNVHVLAQHPEVLAYVGFYMGITENQRRPFERMTTAEIIATTKKLIRDYNYI